MIYDAHSHLVPVKTGEHENSPEQYAELMRSIGVGGGSIFSLPPDDWYYENGHAPSYEDRIAHVLDFCARLPKSYYPFFRFDPTAKDAVEQVVYAKEHGIRGLKVICASFYPEEGMPAYAKAAELDLPILFHSGIIWNGKVSDEFNRPLHFGCLMNIKRLRFALAHVSWPWCDECIALFGKILNTQLCFGDTAQMYIDCSPGAPEFYREDVFRKMALIGYGFEDRLMWGIDCDVNQLKSAERAGQILQSDRDTFERLHQRYSDPAVVKQELTFHRYGRNTIDFRTFFKKMTEENYLKFIEEPVN